MGSVRELPKQEPRVESGAVQFGDDWPGLFMRGDQAGWMAECLSHVISRLEKAEPKMLPSERLMLAPLKALVGHIRKDVMIS